MNISVRRLAVLASTLALLGTDLASAMPAGSQSPAVSNPGLVRQIAFNGVNGRNVIAVFYPGGSISKNGNRWTERNANGSYRFTETGRDDWSVYLVDRSRGVRLQLDLHRKLVLYAAGNGPMQRLYNIVDASRGKSGKQRSQTQVLHFTCNEGIPLVVRIENRGNSSTAFASHDSFPEVRLKQRRSGSGTRYSNGRYTLSMKGRSALFEWDGIQDHCRR
ncbi:MliC family protein [Hoeflea sp.]|uniref:MliC family protein n=1 Tax=Hoeflea sp. TaxID=1940281 RepID=UPI003A8DE83B